MKLFKRTERDKKTGELKQVSNRWWYRFEFKGKVHTASTKLSNYKEAIKVATAKRNEVVLKDAGLVADTTKDAPTPTLADFTKQFLDYIRPRVTRRTNKFYIENWLHVDNYEPLRTARLNQVTNVLIDGFVQARLKAKNPPKPVTINHSLRTLRRALHVAEELGIITKAPKIRLLRGERSREYVVTEEALQKFLALCQPKPAGDWRGPRQTLDPKMYPLLVVLFDTGLRIGEACRLEWSDINLNGRGSVHVRFGKSKNARRFVPLTARAKEVLTRLRQPASPDSHVFTRNSRPIDVTWASHQFTWARRKLKLPDGCVLHSLRHSFLARLGEKGADAYTIQRLAGHANIQQSTHYVHPSEARLESTIALLDATTISTTGGA
jgi:integrase